MGNQNSRSTTPSSNPQSPTSHGHSHPHPHPHPHHAHLHPHPYPHSQHHSARRRESIQALSAAKALAAPSVSLENAESHPTSTRPHSRGRAQTIGTSTKAVASQLRAAQDQFRPPTQPDAMGNEQSSQKGHHHKEREKEKERERERERERDRAARSAAAAARDAAATTTTTPPTINTTPPPQATPSAASSAPPEAQQEQQQQQQQPPPPPPPPPPEAEPQPEPQADPSPPRAPSPTLPVDVPALPREEAEIPASIDPADASDYLIPSSQFSRPPRLPLPIEEEVHTPGSPIISPEEIWSPILENDAEGMLPRRSSMLSTTTADDEDLGEEFKGPSTGRPTVPTLIEWEGPGERVYVTGTFAGWNRKYRLHRNGPSKKKDVLSAHVPVTPGTHHLTFLVDNDMRTSDKMPTAVDYTNILVNYIEVPYPEPQPLVTSPSKENKAALDTTVPVQEREAPAGMYPPQVLPPAPEVQPIKAPLPEPPKPVAPEPTKKYHQNIPRYLLDLDAPEESSRFARANAMTNNLPTPPTLPGFLGKSILNGTTPMKDDSSVLIHPNHTVLNHLATSSIKDNILATSATTRYKQKFLTTIMYKPKEEHSDAH